MKLNSLIISQLNTATGLPVAPDEYDGSENKYIVFTYTNERPLLRGDNMPLIDIANVQLQLITPKSFNYLNLKHTIRDTLEGIGFNVTSIYSFLGDSIQGTEKIRQTVFEAEYAESRTPD